MPLSTEQKQLIIDRVNKANDERFKLGGEDVNVLLNHIDNSAVLGENFATFLDDIVGAENFAVLLKVLKENAVFDPRNLQEDTKTRLIDWAVEDNPKSLSYVRELLGISNEFKRNPEFLPMQRRRSSSATLNSSGSSSSLSSVRTDPSSEVQEATEEDYDKVYKASKEVFSAEFEFMANLLEVRDILRKRLTSKTSTKGPISSKSGQIVVPITPGEAESYRELIRQIDLYLPKAYKMFIKLGFNNNIIFNTRNNIRKKARKYNKYRALQKETTDDAKKRLIVGKLTTIKESLHMAIDAAKKDENANKSLNIMLGSTVDFYKDPVVNNLLLSFATSSQKIYLKGMTDGGERNKVASLMNRLMRIAMPAEQKFAPVALGALSSTGMPSLLSTVAQVGKILAARQSVASFLNDDLKDIEGPASSNNKQSVSYMNIMSSEIKALRAFVENGELPDKDTFAKLEEAYKEYVEHEASEISEDQVNMVVEKKPSQIDEVQELYPKVMKQIRELLDLCELIKGNKDIASDVLKSTHKKVKI